MHRLMDRLARLFALLGGTVLSALILLTCTSIIGRALNTILHSDAVQATIPGLAATLLAIGVGPINGDYEIVEAGMAFAIFAFLPICQLHSGHASVDIFTARLPGRAKRGLRAVIEVVFAAVLVLIAVQLWAGTVSKFSAGQTSFQLQFPVWWGYGASLLAACVAALVAVYVAVQRVREAALDRAILPDETGANP